MIFSKALVIIALGVILCSQIAQSTDEAAGNSAATRANRANVALPKFFDFGRFKSMFRRTYASLREELVREKIFLGNAFRAFVSFFKYKHRKSSTFLKVSEMSDWTEAEHDSILRRGSGMSNVDPNDGLKRTPIATPEEIKAQLDLMASDPRFAKFAQLGGARKKREVSGKSRDSLQIEDLFSEPKAKKEELDQVPSNNPDYVVPELTSFGADSQDSSLKPMEESTLTGYLTGFLGSVASSISNGLYSAVYDEDGEYGDEYDDDGDVDMGEPDEVFIDHTASGCLPAIKHQGQCGSCYIFSTVALYEWQYCTETGKRVAFSEQYPLDCGERVKMNGCKGGHEYFVSVFFGKHGLEMKKSYPYHYRSDICPYEPSTKETSMGYIRLRRETGNFMGIKYEYADQLLQTTPILYGLGVSDAFHHYGGGVDQGKECDLDRGHSMLLVGSGREDGQEYWLFRNSYGESWGLDGYYKLSKKAKHCLMEDGLGYFLKKSNDGSNIFRSFENVWYDSRFVDQRKRDLLTGRRIPENPTNGQYNKKIKGIATPPPL